MRFYIAGKITGNPDYKKQFDEAERQLVAKGHAVMNPACLKMYQDFTWEDYMAVTKAMQMRCEAVFFLSNWTNSRGAMIEFDNANTLNQHIYFKIDDIPPVFELI